MAEAVHLVAASAAAAGYHGLNQHMTAPIYMIPGRANRKDCAALWICWIAALSEKYLLASMKSMLASTTQYIYSLSKQQALLLLAEGSSARVNLNLRRQGATWP
jgi:hypothetical protein